ncbi:MAG: ATP-binding protein [Desulfobacterales bacterium]|nr:ATP-binding protein [Desulfobacterales bacterium]
MSNAAPAIINIALVGGGDLCVELLRRAAFDYLQEGVSSPILAVADADMRSPGISKAKELGLLTFDDYHHLYDRRYNIHLIIVLSHEKEIFQEILKTRPARIRILSCQVFELFWQLIAQEENKLREQKDAMETVIDGIQDFILVLTPEMQIIDVNKAFLKKMGFAKEELLGQKCHWVFERFSHPCDDGEFLCPLKDVIKNKDVSRRVRMMKGRDGQTRYFEISVYPIWEKDGKISKFIHISRDITERKKEEEEITNRLEQMVAERTRQLKETHEKLLHQDKMASLGKLAASVVHEINNPIAGTLNLILLIKRIMDEGPLQKKDIGQFKSYLELMETETRRTSRIVSNLLSFARQSKMKFQQLDLNQLIEKTLILNANLLKLNGVKVTKELKPDLPAIVGSEDQLQQVFMNMVSNAAEAMEKSGERVLKISTQFEKSSGRILVQIKDTGHGIAKEDFSKLFEPFFTTKTKGKGVGLGLSVAYGIVREHSGSIYVESQSEKGATFSVRLPLDGKTVANQPEGGLHGQNQNLNY